MLPDRKELRKLLRYDPVTGQLFWKKRPTMMFNSAGSAKAWNSRHAGKEAFTALKDGYRRGLLFRQSVFAHRVIWRLVTGDEPREMDHVDGDRRNNKWRNLRAVSRSMNQRNASRRKDNTTGHVGVVRRGERWIAQIGVFGTTEHVGIYETKEDAIAARKAAEEEYGFHPNHGRK